jgi:tRNA_anti-like
MKRFAPTAVVLALLILVGWFAVPKANRPGPAPDNDEAPLALRDSPEGDYARRLIEASLKHVDFPQPIRVKDLLDTFDGNRVAGDEKYTGNLVIVVGPVGKVDGATVDFATQAGQTVCRAAFLKGPTGLRAGDVAAVAGDCRGLTGATVQLADCVLLTDEFTAHVNELLAGIGKAGGK